MNLDFKKIFKAAKMPALALIAVTIIGFVCALLGLNIGLFLIPIQVAILGYAGYNSVKVFKLDLVNGAMAGAMASLLSMVFTSVTAFVSAVYDSGSQDVYAQAGMSGETIMVFMFIGFLVMLIFSPIIGFIFGIIGAYIAKRA